MSLLDVVGSRFRREDGQTMAEYGVVLTVITVAVVAVISALSGGIQAAITKVIAILPV